MVGRVVKIVFPYTLVEVISIYVDNLGKITLLDAPRGM
jgi:hypothetical protein